MLHRFLFGGGEGRVCGHGGADTFLGIRVGVEGDTGCFAVGVEVEGSAVLRRPGVPAGEPLVMKLVSACFSRAEKACAPAEDKSAQAE